MQTEVHGRAVKRNIDWEIVAHGLAVKRALDRQTESHRRAVKTNFDKQKRHIGRKTTDVPDACISFTMGIAHVTIAFRFQLRSTRIFLLFIWWLRPQWYINSYNILFYSCRTCLICFLDCFMTFLFVLSNNYNEE